MGGENCPKTKFNPPLKLGVGEQLFYGETENYKMGISDTLFW